MKDVWKNLYSYEAMQAAVVAILGQMAGVILFVEEDAREASPDFEKWFPRETKASILRTNYMEINALSDQDHSLLDKILDDLMERKGEYVVVLANPFSRNQLVELKAFQNSLEIKLRLPVILLNGKGLTFMELAEQAWLALFETFTENSMGMGMGQMGILGASACGMTKDDISDVQRKKAAFGKYIPRIYEMLTDIHVYGMEGGIEDIRRASTACKNLVMETSALKAARYLAKRFGTPYEIAFPLDRIKGYDHFWRRLQEELSQGDDRKRILIAHQQILAHFLRQEIRNISFAHVVCGSCYMIDREMREPWDVLIRTEEEWKYLVEQGSFDIIIADPTLKNLIPEYQGSYYPLNHLFLSGEILEFL